jgi:hypothetical protein
MKTFALFVSLILAAPAFAQSGMPRVEVFTGFSYLSADTNGFSNRQGFKGLETSVSVDLWKYLAVEGNASGYYYHKSNPFDSGISAHDYGFAGGPRFKFHQAFFHSLVGSDNLTASALGLSRSQSSFMFLQGGGVQVKFAPHVSIRTSADWVLTRHNIIFPNGPRVNQNNFRVGVGLVFSFGGGPARAVASRPAAPSLPRREVASEASATDPSVRSDRACGTPAANVHTVALADLGVTGDSGSMYGFRVTAVLPNSAAAKAGIVVNDFIERVNCTNVRNAADLSAALSVSSGVAFVTVGNVGWLPNHTAVRKLQVPE